MKVNNNYHLLVEQIKSLINSEEPILTNLCNVTAAVKQSLEKVSWTGFYILKGNNLHLGPFQGKVACTVIELGKGVCGTAAANMETIVVEDVHKFPGHIACDAESKSEIVVPIIYKNKIWGVLDMDSREFNSFDETDKFYLEQITGIITDKLKLSDFSIN